MFVVQPQNQLRMNTSENERHKNEVVATDGSGGGPTTPTTSNAFRQNSRINWPDVAFPISGNSNYFDRIHGTNIAAASSSSSMPRMMNTINYAGLIAAAAKANLAAPPRGLSKKPPPSHSPSKPTLLSLRDPTMIAPIIKPMTPLDPLFTPGKFDGKVKYKNLTVCL